MTELRAEHPLPRPAPLPVAGSTDVDEEELTCQQEGDVTWEVYADAAFMALHRQPATEAARSLCNQVANRILEWERSQEKRSNERRATLSKFRNAVGLVVGDLVAITEKRPRRWLYRPLAREEFTDEPVSYRDFHAIFEAMRALDLIEVKPGYFSHKEGDCQHGSCTRLRSSPEFLELAGQHGIDLKEARLHFHRLLPAKPLVLRASSERHGHRKIHGRRMKIRPTERVRELEADVREINEFIEEHDLRHGAPIMAIAGSSTAAMLRTLPGTRGGGSTVRARAISSLTRTSG